MQVNNTSSSTQTSSSTTTKTTSSAGTVDSAQFMKILLAQLTHQNPLEPMSDSEMISQFSQLNSLQELRDMNTTMTGMSSSNQTAYLASLIGKTVKVNQADGKILEGVVDGAIIEKGNPQLRIGTKTFSLSDITEIEGTKS